LTPPPRSAPIRAPLPAAAVVGSDGAYAAGKTTKKKPAKKYKKPKKKAPTQTL